MGRLALNQEARASVPNPITGFIRLFFDSTLSPAILRWLYSDGSIGSVVAQKGRLFINPVTDYGVKFDHRVVFDGATTGGTNIITSATVAYTAADVGKRVVLAGAGAAGAVYVGTISSINSTSSANVTPNTTTTVATKGLQIHTDDLTAWTNLINDINNSVYPGAVVCMEAAALNAYGTSGFTNRSGISSFLPTINKQVRFVGIGGGHTSDIGDYTKVGGSCIAYVGTSPAPTAFGAVMTIMPALGVAAQNLKQVSLHHFWIDCRNGDQNAALKGLSLQSCFGFQLDDFYVNDAAAVAIELLVVGPGLAVPNAGSLGEAKDCSRGHLRNVGVRALDNPAGAVTTPITTSSAITLTTSGQSLTVTANTLPASGYAWVMAANGLPVLFQYTGGGGTTTLTGCVVNATDANTGYLTVNGSNIVQAVPGNSAAFVLDGDQTANSNLCHFDTVVISHGTTWGPAAMEFRNSDSNESTNVVINGGNNTNDGAINRIRKPGVRLASNPNVLFTARNNVFKSGSAGVGGCSHMGVNNAGALLAGLAAANTWEDYQLANGEAVPTVEGNTSFYWEPNGGMARGGQGVVATAAQTAIANATTLVTGSVLAVPPQGFQLGTTIRWKISGICTLTASATTIAIRLGTTGTASDAIVASIAPTSSITAAASFLIEITLSIRTLGAAGTVAAMFEIYDQGAVGIAGALSSSVFVTGNASVTTNTINTTTAQQFFSISILTGAVASTITPEMCTAEVIKPANP